MNTPQGPGSPALSLHEVIDQFARAMRDAGISPPDELIADGKRHRYRVEGDKAGSKNGSYQLHADGLPAGTFGTWKENGAGSWHKWCAKGAQDMSAEERAEFKRRIEDMKRLRDKEQREVHQACAKVSAELWDKARELVDAKHPYLVAKGVRAYGIRELNGSLLVPVKRDKKLAGLQFIKADGRKVFKTGTHKTGAGHFIKSEPGNKLRIVGIAEGYATAATVREALGCAVVVAFDAGNLLAVAEATHKAMPDVDLVVFADNDHHSKDNPGLTKGQAAADAVAGLMVAPAFAAEATGTDWNDYAAAQGLVATRVVLRAALDAMPPDGKADATTPAADAPAARVEATPDANGEAAADGRLRPRFELIETGTAGAGVMPGVYFCDVQYRDGEATAMTPLFLCSPLRIDAVTRDAQGRGWGRLVSFTDADGVAKTIVIPARLFVTSRSDELRGALADAGLPLIAGEAKARTKLNDYLMRSDTHARARCVYRTGWHAGSFVLPGQTLGPLGGERYYLNEGDIESSPYQRAGRFERWRDAVAAPCGEHKRALFAIACAFAGPLVELAGAESGGFHLVGGSSSGKTTALRLAATVWGSPDQYWRQWKLSDNGMEAIAADFNDTLLALDEIGQADPKIVGEAAYMLANGRGKQRANKDGSARAVKSWRVVLLSTGEVGTATMMNSVGSKPRAGQEVRLVELPADAGKGMGLFDSAGAHAGSRELATALVEAARHDYGHAGPLFAERLAMERLAIANDARQQVSQFVTDVCPRGADGQVLRVAARFGLVCYAGELATQWGLTGWDFEAVRSACADAFGAWLAKRGTAGAQEPAAMVAQVRAYIEQHGSAQFQNLDDDRVNPAATTTGDKDDDAPSKDEARIINRSGFRRVSKNPLTHRLGTHYMVMGETFKRLVCAGYDHLDVCKALDAAGVLIRGKTATDAARFTKKVRTPAAPEGQYLYVLDGDVLLGRAPA